jgi:hypothetical protein
MRRLLRVLRGTVLCGASAFALTGCGGSTDGGTPVQPPPVVATTITVSPASPASLQSGATLQLAAVVKDQNGATISTASVSWASSDATRASVSQAGLVTGALAGTASITAASGSLVSSAVVVTVVPGAPTRLDKTRDVQSSLTVGGSDSISVTVRDAGGNAIAGVAVTFAVTSGGGSVNRSTVTSDANGVAGVRWTLGTVAVTQTATATLSGGAGTAFFTTLAIAGPATLITKFGTVPATAGVGSNIDSITVVVTDQFSNPRAGEVVTFAVSTGGGTVSPTSVTTGADGRAAARWTIGPVTGVVNTVTATRAGFASPTITWTLTSAAPSVTSIGFTSRHVLAVDSAGTLQLTVVSKDANGNTIAGAGVSYVSRGTAVTVSGPGVVTGVRTGQAFVVATSTVGFASDSVLMVVAVPASPLVLTTLDRFDLKTDTTFTVGFIVDMRASGDKLGATTIQVNWNTQQLTYVSDAEGAANAGATVNAGSTGNGTLTFAVASSAGFAGASELRRITFRASTTAARTGAITIFVGDLTAATTFNNLLSKTVAVSHPLVTR